MKSFIKIVLAICVAGFLLIGGCAALVSAGASEVGSSDPSADSAARGGDENAAKTGTVGTPVTNAGTTYKVTDVRTTGRLGDATWGEQANGTFVVVGLELTNNKNETKTFSDGSAVLVTKDGNQYESSTEASMMLKDDLLMEEIQPDLTTRGHIGFDVPPSKVPGAKLVIEDFWGDGEVVVDLGL